jgi:hypothetical protein
MNGGDKIPHFRITLNDIMPYREGAYAVDIKDVTWWLVNGEVHREDGPAFFDHLTGQCAWFIHDEQVHTYECFQELTNCSDEDILVFKLKWGEL